ncbi:M23 family metallopeptidase [Alkalibacter mobilis]|uniref:M23 family metallopeptidase n=1 Tax=Alkalibacter mobilis TaxID=2787712 RepID=UPI00189FD7BB|nr:M23 family metallopeptidase [Alkalibacter mobilis]MBF7097722.1 peptidoglycan DD-metalloendopeptidase family protein [Alkalibacter mobilis]
MSGHSNHGIVEKTLNKLKKVSNIISGKTEEIFSENKKAIKQIGAGVLVLAIVATTSGYYKSVQGYSVTFNDQEIGMVKNIEDFTEGIEIVKENLSEKYGKEIVFQSDVKFERTTIDNSKLLEDPQESAKAIEATNVTLSVEGAVIVIEGEEVAVLSSYEEAELVIENVISNYVNLEENQKIATEPEIDQEYEIVEKLVPFGSIRETEDVVNFIMQGTDEIFEYEIQTGDTSWDIAVNRGININDLVAANPDKNIEDLHPGEVIKLTEAKPYLDVSVVKEEIYSEKISFETTYQKDSSIYVGKTKEITPGVNGVKEITALVSYENGIQVSKEVVNESVIKEPVTQVVAKGTKPLPPAQGTGRFGMPTSGRVSVINKPGSHSGSRAVDIANSKGTAIYASDAGRVTRASWYSSYGYTIIIDHGNGYQTLYAHLSSMNVSVGQNVSKGQKIAGMGSTGRSTGSHLHFEIRYKGQRQVITKYFSYLRVGGRVSP